MVATCTPANTPVLVVRIPNIKKILIDYCDGDGDGDIESGGDGKKINKIWTFSFIGFFAGWSIWEPNNI